MSEANWQPAFHARIISDGHRVELDVWCGGGVVWHWRVETLNAEGSGYVQGDEEEAKEAAEAWFRDWADPKHGGGR